MAAALVMALDFDPRMMAEVVDNATLTNKHHRCHRYAQRACALLCPRRPHPRRGWLKRNRAPVKQQRCTVSFEPAPVMGCPLVQVTHRLDGMPLTARHHACDRVVRPHSGRGSTRVGERACVFKRALAYRKRTGWAAQPAPRGGGGRFFYAVGASVAERGYEYQTNRALMGQDRSFVNTATFFVRPTIRAADVKVT